MVFVHGAGGNHRVWINQTSRFEGCIAIELPGHDGGSGRTKIGDYAEYLRGYLDEKHLDRVIVVGHSMGGAIVLELALRRPEHIQGLVLVATGARLRVAPRILELLRTDYAGAVDLIAAWAFSPEVDPTIKRAAVSEMLSVRPEVTYGDFLACNSFDRMAYVSAITAPTLVICGSGDRLTPVKYSEYLNTRIRNSKLVVIPGAGHMVMLEKPDEFNSALESFLGELEDT